MSGWLIRLGHSDRLLVGELALPLRRLILGVGLLSVGSHSLPLLKGVQLLRREPGVRPQHDGPWQNHHHSLRGQTCSNLGVVAMGAGGVPMLGL
jgi:hypothetical protein